MIQRHAAKCTFDTRHHLPGPDRIPEAPRVNNTPPSLHTVTDGCHLFLYELLQCGNGGAVLFVKKQSVKNGLLWQSAVMRNEMRLIKNTSCYRSHYRNDSVLERALQYKPALLSEPLLREN